MHDSSTRLSKQSKTSFFSLIQNLSGHIDCQWRWQLNRDKGNFVSDRHSSTNIVGNIRRHSSTRVVNEIVKEKLFPLIHHQYDWAWDSWCCVVFDMDLTKLSVWFIDWSPALLCSDSDYCGRWRRRYELQPTLCDRSCKRFPCPWFTAERSSPVFAAAPYHSFGYIRRRHACHWSVFLYLYLRHITP